MGASFYRALPMVFVVVASILVAPVASAAHTAAAPRPLLAAPSSVAKLCTAPIGVTNIALRGGGAIHAVRIFEPSSASLHRSGTLPVVIDWPGLGLTGAQEAAITNYEPLAEAQGFVVVHPTGVPTGPVNKDSWQLINSYDPQRNDLAFADTLITTLIAHWCVDPRRVYSTGYSNGALFTARLVCERANRIAAAVMVAGVYHPAGCKPARPVPMYAYHGTADTSIPYYGGGRSLLAGSGWPGIPGFFNNVIPKQFAKFAKDFGCDPRAIVARIGNDIVRFRFVHCAKGTPMSFFQVLGGGHTWPGSPLASVLKPLGYTTSTVNATTDGWDFLKRQSLPRSQT